MTKRFLGIICIIYSCIFIYVILFDKLKFFLAPSMQIYLKLSILPLIIIGLVLLFNNRVNYKFKVSDLILLLPIIFVVLAGDGRLTASLVSNRTSNYKNNQKVKVIEVEEIDNKEVKEKEDVTYDFSNTYFDITDKTYSELASYLTYSPYKHNYIGKTIRVRGFAVKKASYIPKGQFLIGKYEISCCAADAGFTGFFVKTNIDDIKENKWYEVEGVLKRGVDGAGFEMLYIEAINIRKIDSDVEEQYVYPCSLYGNGSCDEIAKYNLIYDIED